MFEDTHRSSIKVQKYGALYRPHLNRAREFVIKIGQKAVRVGNQFPPGLARW